MLLDAGIVVREGLLSDEAQTQMQAFMHWCESKRPLVTLKAAMDANGVVDGEAPGRFTSEESLNGAHRLRRQCDAILVGVNTIIRDNPSLNIRRVDRGKRVQPLRIVLDRTLRIPTDAKVMKQFLEIVWKQFLDEGLVDRAIIIQSKTKLGDGPESGIDGDRIGSAGLIMVGNLDWGGDEVTLWSRPTLPWPAHDWP